MALDTRPERRGDLERHSDSEKITLNLGFVDLGQIDLLVREGFYSNRSDFIRSAIRTPAARSQTQPSTSVSAER